MKKLIRGIALLLLPIVLYLALFLALEPNNYFGLRAETPSGAVFAAVKQYQKNQNTTLMLGDSRLAHIDLQLAQEASGLSIGSISFGGASFTDELDMLEWQLEQNPAIDTIIFEGSFYLFNANYGQQRVETIRKALYNPFLYITNFSFNLDVLNSVPALLRGEALWGGDTETEDPATYEYTQWQVPATGEAATLRTTVANHLQNMEGYLSSWQLDEENVQRLIETIEACQAQGIRFILVFPPVHPDMLTYQVEPYGISAAMRPVIEQLRATGAEVYDYEFTDPLAWPDDMFYDGLHLDYERGLPLWTQTFFEELKN